MFNESNEGNKSPEKDYENVEDNTQEEDFVDYTAKDMEIDTQVSKQTRNNFEDWFSQYSVTSSVLNAIDKWNNQQEIIDASQETTMPVFNNVPNFGSDELRGKQKRALPDALKDFFYSNDVINALEKWKKQLSVPDEFRKQTQQDFENECLSGKVGESVVKEVVTADAQTKDVV